jgi:hypothetical protein
MNRPSFVATIILLLFSIAFCSQASRYPFGTIKRIGPGFFPFYVGIVLLVLSLLILAQGVLRPTASTQSNGMTQKKALRITIVLFSLLAYTFLIDKLGFLITTFLFTFTLFKFFGSYRWGFSILGSLIASIANYIIFGIFLHCQFPKGWLGI